MEQAAPQFAPLDRVGAKLKRRDGQRDDGGSDADELRDVDPTGPVVASQTFQFAASGSDQIRRDSRLPVREVEEADAHGLWRLPLSFVKEETLGTPDAALNAGPRSPRVCLCTRRAA
jgi:hypothetical protein